MLGTQKGKASLGTTFKLVCVTQLIILEDPSELSTPKRLIRGGSAHKTEKLERRSVSHSYYLVPRDI